VKICYFCNYLEKEEIPNSSAVERSAVNRLVVGSIPTWGVFIFAQYVSESQKQVTKEINYINEKEV
jgi:hypothetical protein